MYADVEDIVRQYKEKPSFDRDTMAQIYVDKL
jgi:hypothetical protein